MRLRKRADEMTTRKVEFPKPEHGSFSDFRSTLYDIVYENLGCNVAKTLEFDPYEQVFFLTLADTQRALCHRERSEFGNGADFLLSCSVQCDIVPTVAIRPQIEALIEKHKELIHQRQLLQILYTQHLEKQQEKA